MVPEQCPFHATLIVHEDIMQIYLFVLSQVHRETFGSQLPHKPKPSRINLLLNTFSGMTTTDNQSPSEISAVQKH